jgi:hypothetical protein
MSRNPLYKNVLRFRRWSRAGYAVFCSLSRCVSIGRLKAATADCALWKSKSLSSVAGFRTLTFDDVVDEDRYCPDECAFFDIVPFQNLVATAVEQSPAPASSLRFLLNNCCFQAGCGGFSARPAFL